MVNNGLAVQDQDTSLATLGDRIERQRDLIKRTLLKPKNREATGDELDLFLYTARTTGKDPLRRQIYAQFRWNGRSQREEMVILTSIDGYRTDAERSGKYAGQVGPFWCGEDGKWVDVWTSKEPPVAAKVGVLRHDFKEPLWAVALYAEYAQTDRDGNIVSMWKNMAANQTAKCAEALAIRKAFPDVVGGVYTDIEMQQSEKAGGEEEKQPRGRTTEPNADRTEDKPTDAPLPTPGQRLRQAIAEWSGVPRDDLGSAGKAVFNACGVPWPAKDQKASESDVEKMIVWIEDQRSKGVDFAAAVAKSESPVQDTKPAAPVDPPAKKEADASPKRKAWPRAARVSPANVWYWRAKLLEEAAAWGKEAKDSTPAEELVTNLEVNEELPEHGSIDEKTAASKYKAVFESNVDWSTHAIPF